MIALTMEPVALVALVPMSTEVGECFEIVNRRGEVACQSRFPDLRPLVVRLTFGTYEVVVSNGEGRRQTLDVSDERVVLFPGS
jgi:hypothetical protein